MAATAAWYEDNGTATGSPLKGTTRAVASQVDWKSVDNISTPRASATIIAGQNSYEKFQSVRFTGTFTQISAGKFAHTAGVPGVGITLVDKVTSTYSTPSTAAMAGSTDITSVIAIASGQTVLFNTEPQTSSPSATLAATGYTQFLVTQLKTSGATAAGAIGDIELTLQWNET